MPRFVKRPVMVEAQRWDGSPESAHEIMEWAASFGMVTPPEHPDDTPRGAVSVRFSGDVAYLSVVTLEGTMRATPGDWVVRGVRGEFYPVKPDIFAETYDPLPPAEQRVEKPAIGTRLRGSRQGIVEVVAHRGHLIELRHLDGPFEGETYRIGPDVYPTYEVVEHG